jgi:starvation-inducible DNA-binding protein
MMTLTLLAATGTTHSLPESDRVQVINCLNVVLALLLDLKLQVKQAHWNIKGPHFFPLHQLFDTFAAELEAHSDDVAERITALGGVALGTAQALIETSTLTVWTPTLQKQSVIMAHLIAQYTTIATLVRNNIQSAVTLNDDGTADLYTGISRALDKNVWFLEAHQAL